MTLSKILNKIKNVYLYMIDGPSPFIVTENPSLFKSIHDRSKTRANNARFFLKEVHKYVWNSYAYNI
jgi:hypothetical protein